MRPFEIESSVAHCSANSTGSRNAKLAMHPTPNRTRVVTPASAPSSVNDSGRGDVFGAMVSLIIS